MLKSCIHVLMIFYYISLSMQWCLKATLSQLVAQINQVDWSPNSHYIAVASGSNRISVFSSITLDVVWFQTFANVVTSAKFSKNGKLLAVAQANSDTVRIYKVPLFTLYRSFRANHATTTTTIWEVDFSFNDAKIVTCGSDGKVNVATINTGTNDWSRQLIVGFNVLSCQFTALGKIAASSDDGKISVLRSDGFIDRQAVVNFSKDIDARPNSQKYIYGGCTNDTKIYQFDSGNSGVANLMPFYVAVDQVWAVSHARDSSFLAAGGIDGHFTIVDTLDRLAPASQAYFKQAAHINSVRVSDDNNKVAVARADGIINIYKKVCDICPIGFYGNVTCKSCNTAIVGCYTCKNSTLCYTCYLGYYLSIDNLCVICRNNIQGCIQCYNDLVCANCALTYYLNGTICSKCAGLTPQCDQCLNNGTCLKCSYLTYLNPSKTCSFCNQTIPYCRTCYLQYNTSSVTNSTLYCSQCSNGYYAFQNQCLPCPANCMTCVSGAVCLTCIQEYRLVGNLCTRCSAGCEVCLVNGTCVQCIPTTFISTGTCLRCSFPCSTCTTSAITCSSCALGYYLPTASTTCLKCVGCPLCHPTTGVCVSCPIGRYLSNVNTCLNCLNTTSRCMICTNIGCQACQRNYYLTNLGTCQPSVSLTDCIIYKKNSTTECEHCQMGLYVDPATSTCVPCPSECVVCQATTNCKQCHIGFYLDALNSICKKCVNNCITCKTQTQCLSCSDEYYLSGTQCLRCSNQIPYCNSCLNNTHCLNCFLGYRLDASSLSCIQCVSPCAACNISGCTSCQPGYFYQTNACLSCSEKCSSCVDLTLCTGCVTGYTLDLSNICLQCSNIFLNCLSCSTTSCFICKQYYILNVSSNVCQLCSQNIQDCLICKNDGSCQRCLPGYYTSTDKLTCLWCLNVLSFCQRCSNQTSCQLCMSGFYADASSKCTQCMDGCYLCSDAATCHKCYGGYILDTSVNNCIDCNSIYFGCDQCNSTGCYSCKPGFYLASLTDCSICTSAMQGCLVCEDNLICLSCDAGYFLNLAGQCQLCSINSGCSLCNQTSGSCLQCLYGFFLNSSSQCQLCSDIFGSCLICDDIQCLGCQSGSYVSNGTCYSCISQFTSCLLCNSSSCYQCTAGYFLDQNSLCIKCEIQGCQVCTSEGQSCLICQTVYYKVNGTCQLCQESHFGCLSCINEIICASCSKGFYLDANGVCLLCENKYTACRICTSSKCQVCETNYFNNISSLQTQCVNCRILLYGCSICLDPLTCKLCQRGYYLQMGQCLSCTNINQCLFCDNSTNCTQCSTQYYLKNGSCLLCNAAIPGCFTCVSQLLCLSCSGSYVMSKGLCQQAKRPPQKKYAQIKFITQYLNETYLKHTLFSVGYLFIGIHQLWSQEVKIELMIPPQNMTELQIMNVQWGQGYGSVIFYTNNPLAQDSLLDSLRNMPIFKNFSQSRLLQSILQSNLKIRLEMTKQSIKQILPYMDTHNQDIAMYYSLEEPQFYLSLIQEPKQLYYLFGMAVTVLLVLIYFVKVCFIISNTQDTGQIIPHILLLKACGMVIYPNYKSYINYCQGFTQADFPWLNSFFATHLSNLSDQSPSSFKLFYKNLNLSSTYFLAFCVFLAVYVPLTIVVLYRKHKNENKQQNLDQNQQQLEQKSKITSKIEKFSQYILNIFIAGLSFNSFAAIIGFLHNPTTVITAEGLPYILGVLVYLAMLKIALQDLIIQSKISKFRVVVKASLMALLYLSPTPLFVVMLTCDISMAFAEYKLKQQKFVIFNTKVWIASQTLCMVGYTFLIFLSNTFVGIIATSAFVVAAIGLQIYLVYFQYTQSKKVNQQVKQKQNNQNLKNISFEGLLKQQRDIDPFGVQIDNNIFNKREKLMNSKKKQYTQVLQTIQSEANAQVDESNQNKNKQEIENKDQELQVKQKQTPKEKQNLPKIEQNQQDFLQIFPPNFYHQKQNIHNVYNVTISNISNINQNTYQQSRSQYFIKQYPFE